MPENTAPNLPWPRLTVDAERPGYRPTAGASTSW